MLFHITATHTEDNCPGYNVEQIPGVLKGIESRNKIAKRNKVNILGFWSGAPEHSFYMVLDANSPRDIDMFLMEATPFKQAHRLSPVMTADELVEMGKAVMSQAQT